MTADTSHASSGQSLPFIVGIGASAGGLEALEQFFRATPDDSPLAYVVVQHLSPDFKSLMDEILTRLTGLTILRVEDGMVVEPGCVYLIPPKKDMTVEDGRLRLTAKDPTRPLEMPIDIFFRSLARHAGERTVAVILSGTGSDGSRGIIDIHEAGGLVLVQAPDTAKFDGMPRSALDSGATDMSLAPEAMPEIIRDFVDDPTSLHRGLQYFPLSAPTEVREGALILEMVQQQCGIDFSQYKQATIGRRMARRMAMRQVCSLPAYLELLQHSPEELLDLSRDMLIGVTSFFRDREAFDRLQTIILPELLRKFSDQDEFRVWVAGCATGEEVYSLAMLLREEADRQNFGGKVTIFATDVHRQSLETAAQGLYDAARLGGVSEERRARFFREDGSGQCRIVPELRAMIVFAAHNLLYDPPFTRMHLVSCRNMLIYLQPQPQDRVIAMFHFALNIGGVLFLGSSESPGGLSPEFDTLDNRTKFFRKLRDVKLSVDMRLTTPERHKVQGAGARTQISMDRVLLRDYDQLLERHLPTGLLVSPQRDVLHYFGAVARYLPRLAGRAERDVLDMVEGELRLALAAALHRAASENGRIVFRHVRVVTTDGEEWIDVAVESLRDDKIGPPHFHISFLPVRSPRESCADVTDTAERFCPTDGAWERIRDLEAELQTTRENLQATIEELQTTNEELQATNEEMLAANEELQSTNEELHSVNEELYTVNAEFEKKNRELRDLNDDHDNLLRSTEIGTLFLDENLCIRRYNPAITRIFRLLPQDLGRPVSHIAYQLENVDELHRELHAVLGGAPMFERELRVGPEEWLLRRVLPFLDNAGTIQGVVLTFTDISRLKTAEEARHQQRLLLDLAASVPGLVFLFEGGADGHGRFTFLSAGGRDILGADNSARLDASTRITDLVHAEDVALFGAAMERALGENQVLDLEHRLRGLDGCWVQTKCMSRVFEDGRICWNGVCVDITDRRRKHEHIAQAAEFYLNILNAAPALIWRAGLDALCDWFNASWLDFTGRSMEEEMGNGWTEGVHPDDFDRCLQIYLTSFEARQPFEMEYRLRRHDGEYRWILDIGIPFKTIAGAFGGYIGYCFDITERRELTEHLSLATSRAEEASQAKSSFLANMSHEIRTPMNGILGMLQLLKETVTTEEQDKYVTMAMESSQRLTKLLTDILDISRVEAGKLQIAAEPFNVAELLQQVRNLYAVNAEKTGISLQVSLDPRLTSLVVGDMLRLQQILSNLVGNALKFTRQGGIDISATLLREERTAYQLILFMVEDTGVGIPDDKIDTLFTPFSQVETSYTRVQQGAGLGLSICKRLVHLMGGTMNIESEVGVGTTICFTCPLRITTDRRSGVRKREDRSSCSLQGMRLLLAEDDLVSNVMAVKLMEKLGCEVTSVYDGQEALNRLVTGTYDAVIMDIQMPVLDGVRATHRIRNGDLGEAVRKIPIVALTAYAMQSEKQVFMASGISEYIAKPISSGALEKTLKKIRCGAVSPRRSNA